MHTLRRERVSCLILGICTGSFNALTIEYNTSDTVPNSRQSLTSQLTLPVSLNSLSWSPASMPWGSPNNPMERPQQSKKTPGCQSWLSSRITARNLRSSYEWAPWTSILQSVLGESHQLTLRGNATAKPCPNFSPNFRAPPQKRKQTNVEAFGHNVLEWLITQK